MPLKFYISLLFLLAAVQPVFANGDSVTRHSSVNRVAMPEPLSISEIKIAEERVHVSHKDGYNCFEVSYIFENDSDKDFPSIDYGFPIDYLVNSKTSEYGFDVDWIFLNPYEIGWDERLIKDVSFVFNDSVLPCSSSMESVRQARYYDYNNQTLTEQEAFDRMNASSNLGAEYEDGIDRRWYYTAFAMKPHSTATLTVKYKVYAPTITGHLSNSSEFSYYTRLSESNIEEADQRDDLPYVESAPYIVRYLYDMFKIVYDFRPAKHFGNDSAYPLYLNIDLSNLDIRRIEPKTADLVFNQINRFYCLPPSELKPLNMEIWLRPDRSRAHIEEVISNLTIPENEYTVVSEADSVTIDLSQPMFVTDLVCDIDTAQVEWIESYITDAYNTRCHFIYKTRPNVPEEYDFRITSPIILTIAESLREQPNTKRIVLKLHAKDGQTKPECRNVRLLDARFIR